jgi:hypothetical protein
MTVEKFNAVGFFDRCTPEPIDSSETHLI